MSMDNAGNSFTVAPSLGQEGVQNDSDVQITLLDAQKAYRTEYELSSRQKRIELLGLKLRYETLKLTTSVV